jgi:flagellar motor switch protein FliG
MNGTTKAAIILMQLGRERAAQVMAEMEESEIEALTAAIVRLDHIDQDVADRVLEEFHSAAVAGPGITMGGLSFAQHVLEASFGAKRAADVLERVSATHGDLPFTFLQNADPRQVMSLLMGEAPQTIALVLAHLRPDHAAAVLAGLPESSQGNVAHRIALMERAAPDVVAIVAENLRRKASAVLSPQEMSAIGGVQPLVEIINRADPNTEKVILASLDARDKALAEEVRSRMFVFADIIFLEDRAIQLVLRGVEGSLLAVALKGVSEQVRTKITSNLSERAGQNLSEEIDLLGPTRMSQVEEARAGIVQTIRALEETGEIVIRREGEDDYV